MESSILQRCRLKVRIILLLYLITINTSVSGHENPQVYQGVMQEPHEAHAHVHHHEQQQQENQDQHQQQHPEVSAEQQLQHEELIREIEAQRQLQIQQLEQEKAAQQQLQELEAQKQQQQQQQELEAQQQQQQLQQRELEAQLQLQQQQLQHQQLPQHEKEERENMDAHLHSHLIDQPYMANLEKMDPSEKQFFLFTSHDHDKDYFLDGIEIMQTIIHREHSIPVFRENAYIFTDDEIANRVDHLLEKYDLDLDGRLSYPEFRTSNMFYMQSYSEHPN